MTGYLLDRDVLSAAEDPEGNRNVRNWMGSIPDSKLFISAVTVMEGRKGFARLRAKARTSADHAEVKGYEKTFDDILTAFSERILPVDRAVGDCWGEMLAIREANTMDTGVAATAHVHGLIVATRNSRHFRDRGVRLLNSFKVNPKIDEVET